MTLNEIAYNILNLVRGGNSHQDESISLDQIKFNIQYYRAMLIRRDFARNGLVTRHLEQDLGCIELEKVDATKCCKLPLSCHVMKSKVRIPRTVRFNFTDDSGNSIYSVKNIKENDKLMVQFYDGKITAKVDSFNYDKI